MTRQDWLPCPAAKEHEPSYGFQSIFNPFEFSCRAGRGDLPGVCLESRPKTGHLNRNRSEAPEPSAGENRCCMVHGAWCDRGASEPTGGRSSSRPCVALCRNLQAACCLLLHLCGAPQDVHERLAYSRQNPRQTTLVDPVVPGQDLAPHQFRATSVSGILNLWRYFTRILRQVFARTEYLLAWLLA